MSHTTQRRGARAVGAAALLVLAVGGPASARQDAGDGPQGSQAATQITDEQYRCHYLGECTGTGRSPAPTPSHRVDDNAIEYLQLGAGVLAGISLAGAGMAAAAGWRRHARSALPA